MKKKKSTSKQGNPEKPLTENQITRRHISKLIHTELKTTKHRSGYYKNEFTKDALKALKLINPEFEKNKLLARRLNISTSTLYRINSGKKVSSETYKKISRKLNTFAPSTQIKINMLAEKIHKGVKNPNVKNIDKKVKAMIKKHKSEFEDLDLKGLYIYLSYEGE